MKKVSVIVCTKNRAGMLEGCLRSILAAQWPGEGELEVLAIDNGSTDGTPQLLETLAAEDHRLRPIREDRPGKSNALNRGIEESGSDLLIFTDDDTSVEKGWLAGFLRAAEQVPADAYGGKVVAEWDGAVPEWVPRLPDGRPYGGAVVEHDKGDEPVEYALDAPGWPLGANVMFRRRVFEKVGGYHLDLGLVGKSRIGGQDTDMVRRTLEAGMKIVYVPDAVVRHPVHRDRLTKKFFRQWFYSHARGDILADDEWRNGSLLLGMPARDITGLGRTALRFGYRSVFGNPWESFGEQCCLLVHWGHLVEAFRQSRRKAEKPAAESVHPEGTEAP
jgi:GT2 family glycosyltransferase